MKMAEVGHSQQCWCCCCYCDAFAPDVWLLFSYRNILPCFGCWAQTCYSTSRHNMTHKPENRQCRINCRDNLLRRLLMVPQVQNATTGVIFVLKCFNLQHCKKKQLTYHQQSERKVLSFLCWKIQFDELLSFFIFCFCTRFEYKKHSKYHQPRGMRGF